MMTEESKQFFCWGRSCGRFMSPAWETQFMREIRLLRGRLPRKGGGLTDHAQYVKVKSINSSISCMPLSRICYSPDSPVHGDHQSIYPSHGDSIPLFQQGSPSLVESCRGIPTSPYSPVHFVPQMFD